MDGSNRRADWLAWQVVDSAFPTGAFAHSCGLESAWQHGEIPDQGALRRFLHGTIRQTGYGMVPLVNEAFDEPSRFAEFDGLADAFLLNRVANRASRVHGRALLATALRVWPSAPLEGLHHVAADSHAHLAPVSGVVFRAIGVDRATAQAIVLYGAARGVLSAAVRLGIAGSYEAQQLQHECINSLDRTLAQCVRLGAGDLAQTSPLIDILQAGHDRLYSRLFQS